MCVVSMVMDHYHDRWAPYTLPPPPYVIQPVVVPQIFPQEVDEFRKLLERAREYDRRNNEPNCELEEKKAKVRELARQLGVDVSFIDDKDVP